MTTCPEFRSAFAARVCLPSVERDVERARLGVLYERRRLRVALRLRVSSATLQWLVETKRETVAVYATQRERLIRTQLLAASE